MTKTPKYTPGQRYKPGHECPLEAQWTIFTPDGQPTGAGRQVDKGETFPAIPVGYTYGDPDTSKGGRADAPPVTEQGE